MTGVEHYQEAERWLKLSHEHTDTGDYRDAALAVAFNAQAQAHATLALTAATAALLVDRYVGDGDHVNAWAAVGRS